MTPDEFKKIRKAARMTQAQMADRLEVSRVTVGNWESGRFAIPEGALDTLTEKGVAPTPEPDKPVNPTTHPHFYCPAPRGSKAGTFQRTHKHPHWWTQSLWNYLTPAQQVYARTIITTMADADSMVWTPERAIMFTMALTGKTRDEASEICRRAGFDIPTPLIDTFNRAHNAWLAQHGSLAGFYDAHPQFERPVIESKPDHNLLTALDAAFSLTPNLEK